MRTFALPAQYRRLLLLGLLSLLLHLLAIGLIDRQLSLPPPSAGSSALAVRLTHAVAPASPPAPAISAVSPPLPESAPLAPLASDVRADVRAEPPPEILPDIAPDALPGQAGKTVRFPMPASYRIIPPPSAHLRYTITGDAMQEGAASLTWRSDGNRYELQMDGVLGERSSTGAIVDAGIAPAQLAEGSQDDASLLAQLAGMGVADPSQMRGVLEFSVGDGGASRVERYQVLGMENIATGLGATDTLHLVRLGEADGRRLELWLAPAHGWLPAQLRVTGPGGAARTQTLSAIAPAP